MSYIMLPQQEQTTGLGEFVKNFNPALQKAFEYYYAMKMKQPDWEMDKKKLKLLEDRATQETLTGVAKGELPATSIPSQYLNPPKVDTTGLTGTPETMAGIQNLQPGGDYGIRGTPEFMKRVTPQETPQEAQSRMMSSYATQQQAINPYKQLMANKVSLWEKAVADPNSLTDTERMLLGILAKEDPTKVSLYNMLFPNGIQTPNPTPVSTPTSPQTPPVASGMITVTNPQGRRVNIRSSDLDNALKNGYKR